MIPYNETSFHKECFARQARSDIGGASIKVPPHGVLEQVKNIYIQK
jgi:hypothetical protein